MAQVQLEREYQEARLQEDEDWDDVDDEEEDAYLQEDGFEIYTIVQTKRIICKTLYVLTSAVRDMLL